MATYRKRGKNKYQFTISQGFDQNGRQKRKYLTYTLPPEIAKKSALQISKHLDAKAYEFDEKYKNQIVHHSQSMTLNQFVDVWLNNFAKTNLKQSTIDSRINALKNHISPHLGHLKIKEITTLALVDLMNNLKRVDGKGELSYASRIDIYKTLASLFKYASKWNVIEQNPLTNVDKPIKPPKKINKKVNVLTEDELEIVFNELEQEDFHWKVFIILAFTCALRRGELLGLEWKHIDFNNKTISIEQSIVKSNSSIHIGAPKSNSYRVIAIPSSVCETLKEYKKYCDYEKEQLDIIHKNDWLFYSTRNPGKHFYPDSPTQFWRKFIDRINLKRKLNNEKLINKITLHDLRHTSATMLISKNIHYKIIAERLGHSRFQTTMDLYAHKLDSSDKIAADSFDDFFK